MIMENETISSSSGTSTESNISQTQEVAEGGVTATQARISTHSSDKSLKSNNPFLSSESSVNVKVYQKTLITPEELKKYPFKTLNRILDDLKWTIPFKSQYNESLLNSVPIDYSQGLTHLVCSKVASYDLLTLNNSVTYSPSSEELVLEDRAQTLVVIRGLVVNREEVYHFRLLALEKVSNPFQNSSIDIQEYHVIPKSIISGDDCDALRCNEEDEPYLIDDAFFMSSNSPNNHILRVSLFKAEFSKEELFPLTDEESIKARYLAGIEKHPNLSPETVPNVVHCFKTLIKVLRGPISMKPNDNIKTISLNLTVLDTQIDVLYLLEKLLFRLNQEKTELIPPNLSLLPEVRESYIRKVQELIYLGKMFGKSVTNNEFDVNYSYSDNLSVVFTKIPEYDKHLNLVHFKSHNSNKYPFLINLSICSYFPDELIIKCFENTIKSDVKNKLYYVDSMVNTIDFRNGSSANNKLKNYMKNMSAQGDMVGFLEYIEAMKVLGLAVRDNNEINNIDDEVIVAMYKSSFKSDPKNYSYFNRQLQKITKARGSQTLKEYLENEIIPLKIALDELNIEEITEDDVVITAYEYKLNEVLQANGLNPQASEVVFLHKALLSVAVNRKSYLLLNYIETNLAEIIKLPAGNITYSKALEILGCENVTSDFEVITNFQSKLTLNDVNDIESDIRILRYCVKMIAENKKSEILFSFLKNGKVDPSLLPAENWPAGLDNIGNTCYLNSLLQYYFCIKPLRDMVLSFSENQDINLIDNRKIGGRKVEVFEIQRSNQFIHHLQRLFHEMITTNKRCVQPSKELAYLSFLPSSQPVSFKEESVDEDLEKEVIVVSSQSPPPESEDVVMLESETAGTSEEQADLEETTNRMSEEPVDTGTEVQIVPTEEAATDPKFLPISTDQMESTIEVGRQQDVTECIENVTYQIESALIPERLDDDGEQYDLIKKLFYGKTKQTIVPLDLTKDTPRISIERFFSLIINVSDHPKNIYDSLDNYFSEDLVKLDDGYVKKSITICELPEVLQFHVQRVMFDRERLVPYKSLEPIPYSEKIYLDRYLDTEDEDILSKRSEVFKWKSQIQELVDKKKEILLIDEQTSLSIIDSLTYTKKFLESKIASHDTLSINPSTIVAIQDQIDLLKYELSTIESTLSTLHEKVSQQFVTYTKVGYSIFAIFIHRGEASYGHYWVYIKDPHRNVFRKYNDEIITEVPMLEVFNFNEGNTATPYYIVYVKDELEKEYVEPLKRVLNN